MRWTRPHVGNRTISSAGFLYHWSLIPSRAPTQLRPNLSLWPCFSIHFQKGLHFWRKFCFHYLVDKWLTVARFCFCVAFLLLHFRFASHRFRNLFSSIICLIFVIMDIHTYISAYMGVLCSEVWMYEYLANFEEKIENDWLSYWSSSILWNFMFDHLASSWKMIVPTDEHPFLRRWTHFKRETVNGEVGIKLMVELRRGN